MFKNDVSLRTSEEKFEHYFANMGVSVLTFIEYTLPFCIVGLLFGKIFYSIFLKLILRNAKLLNIVTFILWLIICFNLFRSVINWFFDINNLFTERKFSVEGYRGLFSTLLTALLFIFIIIYGLVKNYIEHTKEQAQLITQKSQAELAALKAQINPHFLFNVLNNLYGSAIVEDSPQTAEGILLLSKIMRYVVEGTKNEKINVEHEIRFLFDYLDLCKIRIPDRPNINIQTTIDWDEKPTLIAPMLVIPYVENAFKYGISMTENCFIEIDYEIKNQQMIFICRNSIIKSSDGLEKGTYTGLDNTKRRLDAYYPMNYQLTIDSSDTVFSINLIVNLN
jgi:sensor histidine kinase YesM